MPSFYFFDSLPSTMDEAHARALQGAEEGSVIVASRQTKGRGRRGRLWESELGNLYMTYITYVAGPFSEASQLSFVACVALGEALRPLLPPGHLLTYKWPNDILLDGKKVAGLLLEAISIPQRKEIGCLIGCGLNLAVPPKEVRYPATSFQHEGIFLPLEDGLQRIASSLQNYIALWKERGFSPIHDLWMKNVASLETKICLDLQGKIQEGFFKGIDYDGALLLKTPQGLVKLTTGEILTGERDAPRH